MVCVCVCDDDRGLAREQCRYVGGCRRQGLFALEAASKVRFCAVHRNASMVDVHRFSPWSMSRLHSLVATVARELLRLTTLFLNTLSPTNTIYVHTCPNTHGHRDTETQC
jgi:hypothetical protein